MGVSIRPPIGAQRSGHRACETIQQALVHLLALSYSPAGPAQSPIWYPRALKNSPSRVLFFDLFLVAPKVAPGFQKGGPGCPKGVPKTPKSSQNGLPYRSPKKRLEQVATQCIFREAGCAIRSRLCSPNTLFPFRASAGKKIQKASQKLPQIA